MRVIPCIDGTFRPSCGPGSCIDGSPGDLLVSIAIIYLLYLPSEFEKIKAKRKRVWVLT